MQSHTLATIENARLRLIARNEAKNLISKIRKKVSESPVVQDDARAAAILVVTSIFTTDIFDGQNENFNTMLEEELIILIIDS